MLNPKQQAEVDFWKWLVKKEGRDGFIRRRRADFYRHMNNFDGYADLSGRGIEIGTGCYSQLEWANSDSIVGVEPLNDEYMRFQPERNKFVSVRTLDGEKLPASFSESFDWAVCWNVMDHTPDPLKMSYEIWRVLKHGGYLFFEVNFDDELAKPHYSIWAESTVDYYLPIVDKKWEKKIRNEADKQTLYYAVYRKL